MNRKILLLTSGFAGIIIIVFLLLYLVTGISVKSNIKHCQALFPGSPEDALISYMLDESKHPEDRSHIAIWTLGQIESEKALPHLRLMYNDDPKGKTCRGNHDSLLCQYEIYKAIDAIEGGKLLSYRRFRE